MGGWAVTVGPWLGCEVGEEFMKLKIVRLALFIIIILEE